MCVFFSSIPYPINYAVFIFSPWNYAYIFFYPCEKSVKTIQISFPSFFLQKAKVKLSLIRENFRGPIFLQESFCFTGEKKHQCFKRNKLLKTSISLFPKRILGIFLKTGTKNILYLNSRFYQRIFLDKKKSLETQVMEQWRWELYLSQKAWFCYDKRVSYRVNKIENSAM